MTNAELVAALRRCSYMEVADEMNDGYCKPCAYYTEDSADVTCIDRMMIDAADALEADDKKIAELEAQLPKEGEWIEENRRPKSYAFVCSECGRTAYDVQPTRGEWSKRCRYHYCPNCGAKMDGKEKENDR